MTLVIPPGFADIAIELRCAGDPDAWYLTFGLDIGEMGGDVTELGSLVNEAFSGLLTILPTIVETTGCKVTVGQDGLAPVRYFIPTTSGGQGSHTGAKLPQNCAALVHKDTGIGGRRARGRFFVPAILDEQEVDNVGVISNALAASIGTQLDTFYNGLALGGLGGMVVLHNSEGVSPIIDPTPVVALRLDRVISTQRRRLR